MHLLALQQVGGAEPLVCSHGAGVLGERSERSLYLAPGQPPLGQTSHLEALAQQGASHTALLLICSQPGKLGSDGACLW